MWPVEILAFRKIAKSISDEAVSTQVFLLTNPSAPIGVGHGVNLQKQVDAKRHPHLFCGQCFALLACAYVILTRYMPANPSIPHPARESRTHLLAIDTCGPSGSVALGQWDGSTLRILGQTELAGRSYSATLVAAVAELLQQHSVVLRDLRAIVVVSGPGSFTGVRVGLSAVKGLAEPAAISVVAVSRLKVMASKAHVPSAALDAHRHEVFLLLNRPGSEGCELLAGAAEFKLIHPPPVRIAVCDDAATELLKSAWPDVELVPSNPPTATDAMELALPQILAGEFADLALLDGHYLRRSDAEIFGESKTPA